MARRRSTEIPSSSAALAFASSNATLNAFLGGKQRPWMRGGGLPPPGDDGANQHMPPPHPLPAPPKVDTRSVPSSSPPPALAKARPSTPNVSTPASHTAFAVADRNEPSPSASPALANIQPPHPPQPPNNSTSTSRTTFDVLPSPTPSDECNRIDNSMARTEVDVLREQGIVTASESAAQAPAQAPTQLQPPNSETAPKRVTNVNVQYPSKRLRTEGSTPAPNPTLPSNSPDQLCRPQAQSVLPSAIMSPRQRHQMALCATQRPRPAMTLPQQALGLAHFASSPVLSLPQSPSHEIPPPETAIFPNGDPRIVYMNRIRGFLTSIGGRQNLKPDYAKSRLNVLWSAVLSGDMCYLILHQIFCLSSTRPQEIPGSIRTNPGFNGLMVYLTEVLCSNENLPQPVLTFFSQFPEPLQQFVLNCSFALEILQQITMLINGMQHRNALVQYCVQRKYPPLVIELRETLGIQSQQLMAAVFTSFLRHLWGQLASYEHSFYALAQQVFQNDYAIYQRAVASGALPHPSDNNATIHSYLSLYNQLRDASVQSQAVHVAAQPQMPQQFGPNTGHTIHHRASTPSTGPVLPSSVQQTATCQTPTQPPLIRRTLTSDDSRQRNNRAHGTGLQTPNNINGTSRLATQQNIPRKDVNRSIYDSPLALLAMPANPNPDSALHQTHLRSPILKNDNHVQTTTSTPRLYQFIAGFAVEPRRLAKGSIIQEFRFVVEYSQYSNIPKTQCLEAGQRALRNLSVGHLQYRLRACNRAGEDQLSIAEWLSAETYWPGNSYWELNGKSLECRRKQHYSKDLPIDLTQLVKLGENKVVMYANASHDDPSITSLNVAVEIIEVKDHATIISEVLSRKRSVSEVKAAIKTRITGGVSNGNSNDDDDEIIITSSKFNINLFDPISASQIFSIPVRGKSCAHFDCFDLETFLNSRPSRAPGWPCQIDVWRCPICRGDARPQCLVVDCFMLEVRKWLEEQGKLDTRVITIDEDGNWKPRGDQVGDSRKGSVAPSAANDTKAQADVTTTVETQKQQDPVIDLLD